MGGRGKRLRGGRCYFFGNVNDFKRNLTAGPDPNLTGVDIVVRLGGADDRTGPEDEPRMGRGRAVDLVGQRRPEHQGRGFGAQGKGHTLEGVVLRLRPVVTVEWGGSEAASGATSRRGTGRTWRLC